jgi:hypothetical protein
MHTLTLVSPFTTQEKSRPGRGADHSSPPSAEIKNESRATYPLPLCACREEWDSFAFYFICSSSLMLHNHPITTIGNYIFRGSRISDTLWSICSLLSALVIIDSRPEWAPSTFIFPPIPKLYSVSYVHSHIELCTYTWLYRLWREISCLVAQEPEGSSPHSQQLATGPYPEPVESNPHPQPISLRFILIPLSLIYALVFRVASFLWAIPPKPCTLLSPLQCVPHALPTSLSLTWCA